MHNNMQSVYAILVSNIFIYNFEKLETLSFSSAQTKRYLSKKKPATKTFSY